MAKLKKKANQEESVRKIFVTARMAKIFLEKNIDNRGITKSHVKRLADDILSNDYIYTGDTIKFDVRGNLIDGQHRLYAIIQAQEIADEKGLHKLISIPLLRVDGLETRAREVADTGKGRTPLNSLEFAGIPIAHGAGPTFPAIIKRLGQTASSSSRSAPSRANLIRLAKAYHDAVNTAYGYVVNSQKDKIVSSAPILAAVSMGVIARPKQKKQIERFANIVLSGKFPVTNGPKDKALCDMAMDFRNHLQRGHAPRNAAELDIAEFKTQRVLLAFLDGEILKRFQSSNEPSFKFPNGLSPEEILG